MKALPAIPPGRRDAAVLLAQGHPVGATAPEPSLAGTSPAGAREPNALEPASARGEDPPLRAEATGLLEQVLALPASATERNGDAVPPAHGTAEATLQMLMAKALAEVMDHPDDEEEPPSAVPELAVYPPDVAMAGDEGLEAGATEEPLDDGQDAEELTLTGTAAGRSAVAERKGDVADTVTLPSVAATPYMLWVFRHAVAGVARVKARLSLCRLSRYSLSHSLSILSLDTLSLSILCLSLLGGPFSPLTRGRVSLGFGYVEAGRGVAWEADRVPTGGRPGVFSDLWHPPPL